MSDEKLYQLLQDGKFIESSVLDAAWRDAQSSQKSLSALLLARDLITDAHIGQLIAGELQVPFVQLSKISIDVALARQIPEDLARQTAAIAYAIDERGVRVATSDPKNTANLTKIATLLGKSLFPVYATESDIEQALTLYKKDLKQQIDVIFEQAKIAQSQAKQSDPASILPVAELVDVIIREAYDRKASDIHIEAWADFTLIRYRVDGILSDVIKLPKGLHQQIISRIKVLSRLRTDEHASAQDGKILLRYVEEELDIRVSVLPQVRGEKAVLRLLSAHRKSFALEELGMQAHDLEKVKRAMQKPFGILLSTGPTGSGKTTTMYAILKLLNLREKNISTIEDPVEYMLEGVNQIQVNPKTNLTFSLGLRSLLRQDPDVLYVGEIRDEETADIAINAATTGHLVLSTLHTNDAVTTLPRLMDMGIEGYLVSSTVNVIVAQRLVRRICDQCKISETIDATTLKKDSTGKCAQALLGKAKSAVVYRGKGCAVCHGTGYRGRIGLFEVLELSEEIGRLILQKSDTKTLYAQAIRDGMVTMFEDGISKVKEGVISVDEVVSLAK